MTTLECMEKLGCMSFEEYFKVQVKNRARYDVLNNLYNFGDDFYGILFYTMKAYHLDYEEAEVMIDSMMTELEKEIEA